MKPSILVIEDSKTHLKVIVQLLEEFGFTVLHAENEQDAFRIVKQKTPDLILLELSLPGIGGLEVCKLLRLDQDTGQIPIIILTQKKKIEDKIAAFGAGAQDYLTRPYHSEELKARIFSVLKMRERVKFLEKEKQRLEEQMEALQTITSKDPLTNLLNRKQFLNQLKIEFTRSLRYNLPLTLCSMDIDQFRMVNYQFGESSGDIILSEVALLIIGNFREIDFFSRFDQDHFLACLPQSSAEDALIPVNRFQKEVSLMAFKSVPEECKVTISIGISSLPNANITDEFHLLETASRALLQAKKGGRNQIVVWQDKK